MMNKNDKERIYRELADQQSREKKELGEARAVAVAALTWAEDSGYLEDVVHYDRENLNVDISKWWESHKDKDAERLRAMVKHLSPSEKRLLKKIL